MITSFTAEQVLPTQAPPALNRMWPWRIDALRVDVLTRSPEAEIAPVALGGGLQELQVQSIDADAYRGEI